MNSLPLLIFLHSPLDETLFCVIMRMRMIIILIIIIVIMFAGGVR